MIIDCIADLHGHYPELEGGDLLIVAGDLTKRGTKKEYYNFAGFCDYWSGSGLKSYKNIIVIGGNHDNYLQKTKKNVFQIMSRVDVKYLQDSGTEFEYEEVSNKEWGSREGPLGAVPYEKKKLKIWGSPWTKRFEGMNPNCMAFTVDTDEELAEKWALIPEDIDILVTHCAPYGRLSKTFFGEHLYCYTGSFSLKAIVEKIKPRLHIFGHIHESHGQEVTIWSLDKKCFSVNASHVNERYEPVNKPIRIEL